MFKYTCPKCGKICWSAAALEKLEKQNCPYCKPFYPVKDKKS